MRRVFILGLDCAPPKVLYDGYGVEIHALKEVIRDGIRYYMRSCYPPITIPAWISMFTGKTPGELGVYGFRHRRPGDVRASYIVNSRHIKEQTIWEELSKKGVRVGIVGVPPTYPPKPVNGFMISDFTTPGSEKPYTWPPWLKREIESLFGRYVFDIIYRSHEKERVAEELFTMTKQHLRVVKYLLTKKKWEFFIYVEVGLDRAHHAFWKYFDKEHPRYEEHPVYSKVIPNYYKLIDEWFGEIRKILPKDTVIIIASDHGVKAMKGAFTINEWLIQEGYLRLKEKPKKQCQDLDKDIIDWEHTIAWAWGGYYSRVFINLKGREPRGTVEPNEYEDTVNQLKKEIMKIKGPKGELWRNEVYTPYELYPEVRGDPPDLMVYLDNLSWRPAGTIGWNRLYLPENDRGPDDAVHDWIGVFTIYDPEETIERGNRGEIKITEIYDIIKRLVYE